VSNDNRLQDLILFVTVPGVSSVNENLGQLYSEERYAAS